MTDRSKMACLGAMTRSVRTTEHMEECRACGTEVQFQMVAHPFFGFRAGCDRLKAIAAAPTEPPQFVYLYRWDRHGRKGQRCAVTARGKMNSCRVEFEDGYVMITSRNAVRRA